MLISLYSKLVPVSVRQLVPRHVRTGIKRFIRGVRSRTSRMKDVSHSEAQIFYVLTLIAAAKDASRKRKWGEAADLWRGAIVADCKGGCGGVTNSRTYARAAEAYRRAGNLHASCRIIKLGRRVFPRSIHLYVQLAENAVIQRHWRRALICWEKVLSRYRNTVCPAHFYLRAGYVYRQNELYVEAEHTISKGLSLYPGHGGLLREHAYIAMALKDWLVAIERWQSIMSRTQKIAAKDYSHWIACYRAANLYRQAEELLIHAFEGNEANPLLLYQQACLTMHRATMRWWMNYAYGLHSWDGVHDDSASWDLPITQLGFLRKCRGPETTVGIRVTNQLIEANLHKIDGLWDHGEAQKALGLLRDTLELVGVRSERSLCRLLDVVLVAARLRRQGRGGSEMLLEPLSELKSAQLTAWQWLQFERVLTRSGLLQASAKARMRAAEAAASEAASCSEANVLMKGLFAALELENWGAADGLMSSLRDLPHISDRRLCSLTAYYDLVRGDISGIAREFGKDFGKTEAGLNEYIQGKTIAIVGPADSDKPSGSLIEEHDVVLRLNSFALSSRSDPCRFGSRTDLASFNQERLKAVLHKGDVRYNPDLKFLLIKRPRTDRSAVLDKYKAVVRNNQLDAYQFHGIVNHVPQLIFHLFRYCPAKISLFNVNFFLSQLAYDQSYRPQATLRQLVWGRENLIQGLNFTRRMWMGKHIDADEACEAVLRFTDEQYMAEMERLYAPATPVLKQAFLGTGRQ